MQNALVYLLCSETGAVPCYNVVIFMLVSSISDPGAKGSHTEGDN